jgi:hypothetical protein
MCRELQRVVMGSDLEGNVAVYVSLSSGTCCCVRPLGLRCDRRQADVEGGGFAYSHPTRQRHLAAVSSPSKVSGQWHDAEM